MYWGPTTFYSGLQTGLSWQVQIVRFRFNIIGFSIRRGYSMFCCWIRKLFISRVREDFLLLSRGQNTNENIKTSCLTSEITTVSSQKTLSFLFNTVPRFLFSPYLLSCPVDILSYCDGIPIRIPLQCERIWLLFNGDKLQYFHYWKCNKAIYAYFLNIPALLVC